MAGSIATKPEQPLEAPLATSEEMEYFYAHLEQTLRDVQFLDPENPRHLMRRLRRLFIRANVDKNEVNILRGILTAIDKRGRQKS
jgi:tRNA C32,U32 (ribose-2'-O)-methylase TrmJ